jgi:hypothetical protein
MSRNLRLAGNRANSRLPTEVTGVSNIGGIFATPAADQVCSLIRKTRSALSRRNFGHTSSLNGTFGMSVN